MIRALVSIPLKQTKLVSHECCIFDRVLSAEFDISVTAASTLVKAISLDSEVRKTGAHGSHSFLM